MMGITASSTAPAPAPAAAPKPNAAAAASTNASKAVVAAPFATNAAQAGGFFWDVRAPVRKASSPRRSPKKSTSSSTSSSDKAPKRKRRTSSKKVKSLTKKSTKKTKKTKSTKKSDGSTPRSLEKRTVDELILRAKELSIKGASRLTKDELIKKIRKRSGRSK
jgi:hypothetical protein